MRFSRSLSFCVAVVLLGASTIALADTTEEEKKTEPAAAEATTSNAAKPTDAAKKPTTPPKPAPPAHEKYLKEAKSVPGMIQLYQKDSKLYAELTTSNYSAEYIVVLAIARGIGQRPLLGGMTWNVGDDWVWRFRKIENRIHIVRRNVRFRATKGKPEAEAVRNAFTDSVLFSLPVLTKGPKGGDLIDFGSVFMSDLPQISQALPGFAFSSSKSSWASVKGFKDNVEIEVAATYASSGQRNIETVADSRGVSLTIHYSLSKVPQTGYQPRLADDRIGYFLTVLKDYSKPDLRDNFVRYINRWHLVKADPKAKMSPPKEPLIFWIENTVPYEYRKPVRDGILEWNKAFAKAGFIDAIEVRQQPDEVEWDPEDIHYNTFRWITSSAGFAMGPSRKNPYTGQILDADIIFDASFIQSWSDELTFHTESAPSEKKQPTTPQLNTCALSRHMSQQLSLAHAMLAAQAANGATKEELAASKDKLMMQGIKDVVMHEVGHTLGLRHNFRASTLLSIDDLHNPEITSETGLSSSVMDYVPVNIAPKGETQGDFFSTTLGVYDYWAIEYGYKPLSGGTTGEVAELKKIASRSGEKGLGFATDEQVGSRNPDPEINIWDIGDDLVAFGKARAQLARDYFPGLVDRMVADGDDFTQARRAFNVLLSTHGEGMFYASRYVGGVLTSRSHKGDKDARPPFTIVAPKKQRESLSLLEKEVFGRDAYTFIPRDMHQYLGPLRWRHWGATYTLREDYPIHNMILARQVEALTQLLSPGTLERIADNEYKTPPGEDAFTNAELIQRLTKAIFAEVDTTKAGKFTARTPAISSLRRNLQREYLERLANIALGKSGSPHDCRTIAAMELTSLQQRVDKLLKGKVKLDPYSRAHLIDTTRTIELVLDADLVISRP